MKCQVEEMTYTVAYFYIQTREATYCPSSGSFEPRVPKIRVYFQVQALECLVKSERFAMDKAFDVQKSSQLKTNDRAWQLKLEAVNRFKKTIIRQWYLMFYLDSQPTFCDVISFIGDAI